MRSTKESYDSAPATGSSGRVRGAGWVWWGLVAAFTLVLVFSVVWAVRSGSPGQGKNRGPADEAAPGSDPAQHIDRSSNQP